MQFHRDRLYTQPIGDLLGPQAGGEVGKAIMLARRQGRTHLEDLDMVISHNVVGQDTTSNGILRDGADGRQWTRRTEIAGMAAFWSIGLAPLDPSSAETGLALELSGNGIIANVSANIAVVERPSTAAAVPNIIRMWCYLLIIRSIIMRRLNEHDFARYAAWMYGGSLERMCGGIGCP